MSLFARMYHYFPLLNILFTRTPNAITTTILSAICFCQHDGYARVFMAKASGMTMQARLYLKFVYTHSHRRVA